MAPPHLEALLAAGYALFLLLVGAALDAAARRVQRRAERYRTGGFTYHAHLDAFQCPQGQPLWRHAVDHELRLVRYRAQARTCNACPVKDACTDSGDGREVTRTLDPWPSSEAGRFQRGMSLLLAALAAFLLAAEAALRHHAAADLLVLGGALAAVAAAGRRLLAAFRASPANFPPRQDDVGRILDRGQPGT